MGSDEGGVRQVAMPAARVIWGSGASNWSAIHVSVRAMPSPVSASSSAWSLELALCTVDHLADPMRNGSDPPPKGATPGIAVLSDVALIAVNAP
jgi:hypothetical protein